MIRTIQFKNERQPVWNEEQRLWMGICEFIVAHWYFMLKPAEVARLYSLKYPMTSAKTIRDAYVNQYYSEKNFRGTEFKYKRDTLLTPIVDDDGTEYLAYKIVETKPEFFEKFKSVHGDKKMYMPTVNEMEEYFDFGFNPSNDEIIDAFAELTLLVPWLSETEQDRCAQGTVCNAVAGFEQGVGFDHVLKTVMEHFPYKDTEKVSEQLGVIFNNTHMRANKGYTPLQLEKYYGRFS